MTTAAENLTRIMGNVQQGITYAGWIIGIVYLLLGAVLLGAGLWIYFKNIKVKEAEGKEKPSGSLYVACILLILIGALLVLGGILNLLMAILAPTIISEVYGA